MKAHWQRTRSFAVPSEVRKKGKNSAEYHDARARLQVAAARKSVDNRFSRMQAMASADRLKGIKPKWSGSGLRRAKHTSFRAALARKQRKPNVAHEAKAPHAEHTPQNTPHSAKVSMAATSKAPSVVSMAPKSKAPSVGPTASCRPTSASSRENWEDEQGQVSPYCPQRQSLHQAMPRKKAQCDEDPFKAYRRRQQEEPWVPPPEPKYNPVRPSQARVHQHHRARAEQHRQRRVEWQHTKRDRPALVNHPAMAQPAPVGGARKRPSQGVRRRAKAARGNGN